MANEVEYSLLARPMRMTRCGRKAVGAGLIAWSPVGRGVLTGKYRHGTPADSRGASPHLGGFVGEYLTAGHRRVVDAVCTAADEGLGVAPVEVAVAWVRDRPAVSSRCWARGRPPSCAAPCAPRSSTLPAEIRAALDEVSAGVCAGVPTGEEAHDTGR